MGRTTFPISPEMLASVLNLPPDTKVLSARAEKGLLHVEVDGPGVTDAVRSEVTYETTVSMAIRLVGLRPAT